ncbi:MAG: hypothetical protein Q9199_002446 [Rusavskia elegans]
MARVKQFTEDASKTAIRVKQVMREGEVKDGKKSASKNDTKLRLRKPSLDLDATNSTTHAFVAGSERATRDGDIKIHNTRSRSRSTGKSNNIVTPRDGKRSAVGKPPKKKDIASWTWQSSSSSFRSQGKPRQRAKSPRIPRSTAESHTENPNGSLRHGARFIYKDGARFEFSSGKKFMWVLKFITGSSTGAWTLAVCLLLVFSGLLLGTFSWVLTKADQVAMVSCQWSWLRPMCVFACAHSPWPGRYVFSTTCCYRSARSNITLEPELAIEGMYDLPSMLHDESFDCTLHQPFFLEFEYVTLLMSPEEKDAFMTNHSKLCSVLKDTSHDLSHYYQHVNRFSELILQQPNTANAGSGSRSATATGSQSHPPIQQMDSESVSSFISAWQKNYDTLVTLGIEFAGDIDHYRHELRIFRTGVSQVREKTAGARQDVVNKWPFIRRFGHDVGLFRVEPPEVWGYNHALDVLDPWLTAILTKENLLALVWTNVTAIHEDLDAQVAARFSADALSLFGPAASLSVQSWLAQIRQKAGS